MRITSLILGLAVSAGAASLAAADETVVVDFGGGNGNPRFASKSGDIDGLKPLDGGNPVFRLAPGDRIRFDVEGPTRTFTAKTVEADADSVKVSYRTERRLVIFSRSVKETAPDPKHYSRTVTAEVGNQVQVYLVVSYLNGKDRTQRIPWLPKGKNSFRLDRPANVTVKLDFKPGTVAWADGGEPTPDDQAGIGEWIKSLEAEKDREEVKRTGSQVLKGDLETLQVKLIADRP